MHLCPEMLFYWIFKPFFRIHHWGSNNFRCLPSNLTRHITMEMIRMFVILKNIIVELSLAYAITIVYISAECLKDANLPKICVVMQLHTPENIYKRLRNVFIVKIFIFKTNIVVFSASNREKFQIRWEKLYIFPICQVLSVKSSADLVSVATK